MDSVSCANPQIKVLESKLKVDGITKYVEDHSFTFDNTFNEQETHQDLYNYTLCPLVDLIFNGGVVTCFAYGQTGSGKTYTMVGVQELVLNDIYLYANKKYSNANPSFFISFFEIYGGRCYDLLNNKSKLNILEDKNNNVLTNLSILFIDFMKG
jgi:kinesin family protein 2/24